MRTESNATLRRLDRSRSAWRLRDRAGRSRRSAPLVAAAIQGNGAGVDSTNPSVARAADALPASALGSGDVFEVRVFQEPDLSGAFRVGPDGTVEFPLCKTVEGGRPHRQRPPPGRSLTACAAMLLQEPGSDRRSLREPQLTQDLRLRRSAKAGHLPPFEDGMSVVQAVALAGGFTCSPPRTAAR